MFGNELAAYHVMFIRNLKIAEIMGSENR
ncbi:hypothetical protein SHD_2155 [Shewanella decolorationis S12]|uniref:Uncharacterized protein n=1 Tax=Shewanella decolorationis S12 TaxID=1353536 RepID=A0ABP2Z437_9GAMM|nr:hypothetical protein SHD_2155 [Shewanella decolorationis S12]